MSMVRFKITNHPQQVAKRGASDTVDERITPTWLFDEINKRFAFTLDVAANAANTKCPAFFDLATNGLDRPWAPHRVWCNPPFSNLAGWLQKAWYEYLAGCPVIVMLLPANRTEQKWWQEHVEPFRDGRGPIVTEFIPKRFNFGMPGAPDHKFNSSPPFGCVLVIFGVAK